MKALDMTVVQAHTSHIPVIPVTNFKELHPIFAKKETGNIARQDAYVGKLK